MKNILAKYVQFDRSLKVHSLLAILTVGTFAVSAMLPWMAVARGEAETIEANGVLTLVTAQQAAAKITVRVRMGQGGGSGVLLAKKSGTYLVLTNAHVVQGQAGVSIMTPDGQVHGARRVQDAQVGDFDLALLEFNSARAYDLAKLDNFKDREKEARLREGYPVFAAGFSYNADGLKLVEGKITQLPQEAFKNGTQVGYVTQGDLIQGMSGGPVLAINGDLVGINSTLARSVIDNYVYADGSKAPSDKVEEYRKANWSVPIYNLLTRMNFDLLYGYEQLPKLHRTVSPNGYMATLDRKARNVSVRIEKQGGGNGSGVIVAKEGDNYYVLTSEHVVVRKSVSSKSTQSDTVNVKIITADQRSHEVFANNIVRSEGTDLAIVKFTSPHSYQVATLGDYNISNGIVFASGWPAPQNINSQQWQWHFNPGNIKDREWGELYTQDKNSFSNGYDLIYGSITHSGMSGGALFDTSGQVIGIHGRAEGNRESFDKPGTALETGNILGNSLGISIKTFIGVADKLGINPSNLQVVKNTSVDLTTEQLLSVNLIRKNVFKPKNTNIPEQWIEYGNHLSRVSEYTDAVKAFDRAIILKPNSINAYYGRGRSLENKGDHLAALKSFDQSISIVPQNQQSNFYYLWKYRSYSLASLNRNAEALDAISYSIKLEPTDITILNEKALLLFKLRRYAEAINIYNEIIPQNKKSWAYFNRGNTKANSEDYRGAMLDYDESLKLDPKNALNYVVRGSLKSDLRDKIGAISDYDTAINIDPKVVAARGLRAAAKFALQDYKGAILDYNVIIDTNPQDADSYGIRGGIRYFLGDEKGGIEDLKIAAQLFKSQNDSKSYDRVIELIQKIPNP
jgi:tetratricopeptide (TPR) repeat protein/S1-C subfamily serine protease